MSKSLEEFARSGEAREKALKNLNSQTLDVVQAQRRAEKARKEFETIRAAATTEYEEKLEAIRNELNAKGRELEAERSAKVNDAKSALGTAEAELGKIEKKYTAAHARLIKLLPPEDLTATETNTKNNSNGATNDRSHAQVG